MTGKLTFVSYSVQGEKRRLIDRTKWVIQNQLAETTAKFRLVDVELSYFLLPTFCRSKRDEHTS